MPHPKRSMILVALLFLGACGKAEDDNIDTDPPPAVECTSLSSCDLDECASICDADADGFYDVNIGGDDCDDGNAAAYPGADELCDGVDNSCNGLVDDDDSLVQGTNWYGDSDGDGFGNPDQATFQCDPPNGPSSELDTDCDDSNANINPDAVEVCDGFDNDCDGDIDDDDDSVDVASMDSWWLDSDGDGLGDPLVQVDACEAPAGHTNNADDCDDSNDTLGIPGLWYLDVDGDGYGAGGGVGPQCGSPGADYVQIGDDCDDGNPTIYPGAYDLLGDGIDQSCSGFDGSDLTVEVNWTDDGNVPMDTDGDGYPDVGCGDDVEIEVFDPAGETNWYLGMSETGSPNGWTGEDCYLGYAAFNYCHPFTGTAVVLHEVLSCSVLDIVPGSTTFFSADKNPFMTYFLEDSVGSCYTWGEDPTYYGPINCTNLN